MDSGFMGILVAIVAAVLILGGLGGLVLGLLISKGGEAFLNCLSTVLATLITGACGVVTALISAGVFSAPSAQPVLLEFEESGAAQSAGVPWFLLAMVLIAVFLGAFFVARRLLGWLLP